MFPPFGPPIEIAYLLTLPQNLNLLFLILELISGLKMYLYPDHPDVIQLNRLRIGHYLLPSHDYKLNLNDSPFCTLHLDECLCDLSHILFDCPSLSINRSHLISSLNSLTIQFNLPFILNLKSEHVVSFIQEAGFVIWPLLYNIYIYTFICLFIVFFFKFFSFFLYDVILFDVRYLIVELKFL